MATSSNDIRKTGPQSYRDLQKQNAGVSDEDIITSKFDNWKDSGPFVTPSNLIYEGVTSSPLQQSGTGDYWGKSKYDNPYANEEDYLTENLNDTRYENQPWTHVLANGMGKMLGTAGTTFVSSLIGLPYGLGAAVNEGRWSALWDNDVTRGLAGVDEWLENNLTNYKSQKQQNSKWYDPSNLFSMNFIADDVIKNAGFTLGAAASMAVGSGALGLMSKSLGFVNEVSNAGKVANNVLSALFSATGEGMIEARQGVEERNKLEKQKLYDSLLPEEEALANERSLIENEYALNMGKSLVSTPEGRAVDPAYERYKIQMQDWETRKNLLDQKRAAGEQQIEESGKLMGNKILLANQALLSAGNLIQFSKGMTKSFDKARHAAEMSTKTARPAGVAAKRVSKDIADGYKVVGKPFGIARAATKGLLTEGSEEMNQQWIQSAAGEAYNEYDVNDYWKAKMDPDSYRETTKGLYTWGKILDRGFDESWGDIDQWEQFVIGGLTGMAGSYMPSKIFNQDKTKSRLDPRRYGSWEGGIVNELRDFRKDYNQFTENVEDLNKILKSEDFPARMSSMVGHTYTETQKEDAAIADDKKSWKDADEKQNIHDIQAFLRAGKLSDLRAIYDELAVPLSDDDVQSIIKSTTREITDEDGSKHYDGAYVDKEGNQIKSNDEIRAEIKHNAEELNRKLDSYLESIDFVNKATGGQLTKDQEDNLVYLHNLGKEDIVRMEKIMAKRRSELPSKFLLKTDKTPEQLAKEFATSDVVFTKNDDTKEGYIEADASLMTDATYARFLQEKVLRGGNINPEFGETAEEKAARKQAEKNLSKEEKKIKTRERATKKWRDALQRMSEDAAEQSATNWDLIQQNFESNFRRNNPRASQQELLEATNDFLQDMIDAGELYNQAGEYFKTVSEYLENPTLIDKDKEKEAEKADKDNVEKQAKNKFAGKDSKQMSQDLADGSVDLGELMEFSNLGDESFDDLTKEAKGEAKKAVEKRQKASALKSHIQDFIGDNPSDEDLAAFSTASAMIDAAELDAVDADAINPDMPQFNTPSTSDDTVDLSEEDLERNLIRAQQLVAFAFNAVEEDKTAQDNIPEEAPEIDDVEAPETGYDATTKVQPDAVAPSSTPSKAGPDVIPESPLDETAVSNIIAATNAVYDKPVVSSSDNGTWRSTTTRNVYGKSTGLYHENVAKQRFGVHSIEYKRSKAIWEYLNSVGAFDRVDNAGKDRIQPGDTIHFMVKYFPQIYEKEFNSLTEEEKPKTLVILMVNENGEVLGDLPLAQFEPSYKSGNPNPQVKSLLSLQDKVFKAFEENYNSTGSKEAIVDKDLKIDNVDNLNLTFDNAKKSPLVSAVKQVMKGVVPYRIGEINTLNDVTAGASMQFAVKVDSNRVAVKRKDKAEHNEIVLPSVGSLGQPYLLLPTASGQQIAVPFYMPMFDAAKHQGTQFYNTLKSAIQYLLLSNSNTLSEAQKKEYFSKHLDVLEGLLQVQSRKNTPVIEVGKDTVTLHLQSLTDPDKYIDVTVSKTGNADQTAAALAEGLSGIPINVSLEFLNNEISTGITGAEKRSLPYNIVIGEIATINLPKETQHTVNSWFTVELAPSTGIKKSAAIQPRITGKHTEVIGGRSIEIDADKLEAVDTATGEIITDNEEVLLRLAQIKANRFSGKDFIQIDINGETRTYDVKNNKFTKAKSTPKKEKTAENASTEEVKPNPETKITFASEPAPQPQPVEASEKKTIEQINKEVAEDEIINNQSADAWGAIPDALKLKMYNEGTPITLSFSGRTETISLDDIPKMQATLESANTDAKKGGLSISEAVKPMEKDSVTITRENEKEARKWLAKNLPMLSSEERTQFVDTIARAGDNAGKLWGSYRGGVIEILRNAPRGTVYHEAFHYVLDVVLSPEERRQVLDAAKKEYGQKLSDFAAEERLANDFRRYALDENTPGIVGTIKKWIRKIMDRMKRYNRISEPTITQLFWKINNGELAQKSVEVENFEDYQQRILGEIRNVQRDNYKWNNLDASTRRALKDVGLTEEHYNEMSLEEQQQYVRCRG